MTLVVDASVAFKWFAQEDGTDRALQLLERGEPIVAPDLIVAEVGNARGSRCAEANWWHRNSMRSSTTSRYPSPAWCRSTS